MKYDFIDSLRGFAIMGAVAVHAREWIVPSSSLLRDLASAGSHGVQLFFVVSAFTLLEEQETYDLLLTIDVFEHVPDYLGFLKSLRSRAEMKVFHIPLDLSVSSVLRPQSFLRVRRDVGHLHYFSQETAIAALEDCGYQILDAPLTAGALEVAGKYGTTRTRLANFPRRIFGSISQRWAARILGGWSLLVLAK